MANVSDIKVIIPLGGEAVRMRPISVVTSKAMIRILNRPLIEFTIAHLAKQGIKEFIFGIKGYVNFIGVHDYFQQGYGISSKYKIEPRIHIKYQPRVETVGNADSVRINIEYYDIKDPIMVVQGDNIFQLDANDMLSYHERKESLMTIALKPHNEVEDFGVAKIDNEMRILNFIEKPRRESAPSNLINTGLYMLSPLFREIFEENEVYDMRKKGSLDFGKDLIPYLIRKGYKIYGYQYKGYWFDVGTPRRYLEAFLYLLKNLSKDELQGEEVADGKRFFVQGESPDSVARRVEIRRKVREGKVIGEGSILVGRHCQLGNNVYLEDTAIDNFSVIGNNVKLMRSSIMDRTIIGENCIIENSIIGRHTEIRSTQASPTTIKDSIIADNVVIGEGCNIISTSIYPHKTIMPKSKFENEIIS